VQVFISCMPTRESMLILLYLSVGFFNCNPHSLPIFHSNQANITVFRRMRKTDQNRIAKACGATIVSRPDEIQPSDVGTGCGLFKVIACLFE